MTTYMTLHNMASHNYDANNPYTTFYVRYSSYHSDIIINLVFLLILLMDFVFTMYEIC